MHPVLQLSVILVSCEVSCLRLDSSEETIFAANGVADVQEYDANARYQLRHTYKGHTGWIYDLQGDADKIVSAADDKTIRVWERKTEQREGGERAVLRGHTGGLRCLQYTDNVLATGSWDKVSGVYCFVSFHSMFI